MQFCNLYLNKRLIPVLISFRSITMGSIPTGLIVALLIVTVRSHVPQESSAMDPPQAPGVADIVKLILGYITPRSDPLPISESCKVAGDDYLNSIADNKAVKYNQYMNMLDSSALLPSSGFLGSDQNIFHHPGSFSECLGIKDEHGRPMSQYCLLTAINVLLIPPDKRPQLFNMSHPPSNEHLIPDGQSLEEAARAAGKHWNNDNCPLTGPGKPGLTVSHLVKIGKCLPIECTKEDIQYGGINMLSNPVLGPDPNSPIIVDILSCHTADEKIEITDGDIVMITVVAIFGCLITFSTFLDVGITVLGLTYLPESLLPIFQGFSAYHNTVKIFTVGAGPTDGSNLSCINGLKYITISWIVLGHTLWEWILVGQLGAFTKSISAVTDAAKGIAFTAVWNGLFGVDTFFVIGGCLLAFHTLKEIDKTKGGNMKMWAMFYVHRYIRLTGVYAIIIFLHATLLKWFATGPQSQLVDSYVKQCQKGWWTNLLYINNFAPDIFGPGNGSCVNVSWYMAIDMQYFVLTPIVLTLLWKSPKIGQGLIGLLIAAGAACQIYFTIENDEYFHGGFGYYVKPWNRSHPYLIGILLGYVLHKMRDQPKLNINMYTNLFIWAIAGAVASSCVYSVNQYNLVANPSVVMPCNEKQAPLVDRVIFNGFSKIAWSLSISWLILACVKQRGGFIDSFLSWSFWVPLARLQYCVYLLHRTIILINNSWVETVVRYSHTMLAFQFIGILAISTFAAFVMVVLFEAPIVQLEKIFFASLGMGRMPQKRKEK